MTERSLLTCRPWRVLLNVNSCSPRVQSMNIDTSRPLHIHHAAIGRLCSVSSQDQRPASPSDEAGKLTVAAQSRSHSCTSHTSRPDTATSLQILVSVFASFGRGIEKRCSGSTCGCRNCSHGQHCSELSVSCIQEHCTNQFLGTPWCKCCIICASDILGTSRQDNRTSFHLDCS